METVCVRIPMSWESFMRLDESRQSVFDYYNGSAVYYGVKDPAFAQEFLGSFKLAIRGWLSMLTARCEETPEAPKELTDLVLDTFKDTVLAEQVQHVNIQARSSINTDLSVLVSDERMNVNPKIPGKRPYVNIKCVGGDVSKATLADLVIEMFKVCGCAREQWVVCVDTRDIYIAEIAEDKADVAPDGRPVHEVHMRRFRQGELAESHAFNGLNFFVGTGGQRGE